MHRDQLNIGVECAMLYYLTEDERYAQIASDILCHYVKIISVKSPQTFKFYEPNFNHLIQCRELFPRVAMIYDFVQPYISKAGVTVLNGQVTFNFDTSQKAFEVMAENDPIYQTQRIGIEAHKFDVPNGTYELSILLAGLA